MRVLTIATVSTFALAGLAQADFVDLTYAGTGAGSNVAVYSPVRNGTVFAGQIYLTLSNSTGLNLNGSWVSFCSDLGQNLSGGTNTYEIVGVDTLPIGDPMGAAKAQAIADMYSYAAGAQLSNTASNNLACAFQLAIWEIIHDFDSNAANNGLDITSGLFHATKSNGDAFSATLMGHLADFFGAIGTHGGAQLLGLGNGSRQDQILEVSGFIPGPGALALGALAGVLGASRRRR